VILHYLPGWGDDPPAGGALGYKVHDTAWVRDVVVVLGQQTVHGRDSDHFVIVVDHDGRRVEDSGVRTTPSYERARELFDHWVAARRRAA